MELNKIILIDDDPEDRAIIIDAFEMLHAKDVVSCAANGEAALTLLDRYHEAEQKPCLIVIDLNMPRMNGTETLKHLKKDERFHEVPIVIYSTSINPLEKEKCMLLGAHSYITKPVSFQESMDTAKLFLSFCEITSQPVRR